MAPDTPRSCRLARTQDPSDLVDRFFRFGELGGVPAPKNMEGAIDLIMVLPTLSQLFVGTEPVAYPANALDIVDEYAKEYLREKAEQIKREDGLKVEWKVVQGDIVRAITEGSDAQPHGMIAMSTHGRTGLGRWVLGSVTDKVIRSSGKPVLVVRPTS